MLKFFSGVKSCFFEAGQNTCQEKPCHFPQAIFLTLSISQPHLVMGKGDSYPYPSIATSPHLDLQQFSNCGSRPSSGTG